MNKKGFTLIELLAVIIALIATPVVMNTIADAQEGADKNAAYNYINAVEQSIMTTDMLDPNAADVTAVTSVDASLVKGTAPSTVSLTISNGRVVGGTIAFKNNTFTVSSDGTVTKSS